MVRDSLHGVSPSRSVYRPAATGPGPLPGPRRPPTGWAVWLARRTEPRPWPDPGPRHTAGLVRTVRLPRGARPGSRRGARPPWRSAAPPGHRGLLRVKGQAGVVRTAEPDQRGQDPCVDADAPVGGDGPLGRQPGDLVAECQAAPVLDQQPRTQELVDQRGRSG